MKRVAVVIALSILAAAANAETTTTKDGRICTLETVVGSHMPKRVCSTAAEREAYRKSGQDKMMSLRQQGAGMPARPAGGAN